jgi:hypothetical protein
MLRLILIVLTAAACVGAGTTAGPVAFASEFHWPLSEPNFRTSVHFGLCWGIVGALIAAFALALTHRKYLWITAVIAIVATWLITFAGVWFMVVSSLG